MNFMTLSSRITHSRETVELIITAIVALMFTQLYQSSPIFITSIAFGGIILFPLFFKKPEYCVFLLVIMLPLREFHLVSALYVIRTFIWSILIYLLLRQLAVQQKVFSHHLSLFNKVVGIFMFAIMISVIQAFSKRDVVFITNEDIKVLIGFGALVVIEQFLLVYIVYYAMTTLAHIRRMLDLIMSVSIILSLIAIWQYLIKANPPLLHFLFYENAVFYGRATSLFTSPNECGIFMAAILVMAISQLFWDKEASKKRISFLLSVILLDGSALLLSFSRTSVLAFFFGFIFSNFLYYTKICPKIPLGKLVMTLMIILIGIWAGVHYYELFLEIRFARSNYHEYFKALQWTQNIADYGRIYALQKVIPLILQHPLLGIGYNVFTLQNIALGLGPHNQYISILVEMGLFGFIPFMFLLGIILKTGFNFWNLFYSKASLHQEQFMIVLLLSGIGAILFSFLLGDTLNYRSISGLLWLFSGAILMLDRECKGIITKNKERF